MNLKYVLPLLIILSTASIANASGTGMDDTGWYVGGALGYSATKTEASNSFSQKENAGSLGIYWGYNYTDWIGLEVVTLRTGDVSSNRPNLNRADIFAVAVTPKFTKRFNHLFSLYGKVGLALLIYTEEYDDIISPIRDYDESWGGTVPTIGIGGQFDVGKGMKIRISHDIYSGSLNSSDETWYRKIPDVDVTISQLSFGLHYQF